MPKDTPAPLSLDKENAQQPIFDTCVLSEPAQTRAFGCDLTNRPSAMEVEEGAGKQLYAREIFDVWLATETVYSAMIGYMRNQPDINERMRAILVDWLIEVHLKFRLHSDTLFLTINIVDRVLEKMVVYRQQLQLVGVTAMFIAAKYEEIYPPEIKDLVYITDSTFLRDDILEMEGRVLRLLEYRVTTPSAQKFLERFEALTLPPDLTRHLSRYLLELALVDYKMLRYKPSVTAAAALYLARKIHSHSAVWPTDLYHKTDLCEGDIKACAKDLCVLAQNAEKGNLQAARKKYALSKFEQVSTVTVFRVVGISSK